MFGTLLYSTNINNSAIKIIIHAWINKNIISGLSYARNEAIDGATKN